MNVWVTRTRSVEKFTAMISILTRYGQHLHCLLSRLQYLELLFNEFCFIDIHWSY